MCDLKANGGELNNKNCLINFLKIKKEKKKYLSRINRKPPFDGTIKPLKISNYFECKWAVYSH